MSAVRLRRLQADHQKLAEYIERHPRLRLLAAEGEPPERYKVEYQIRSLRQVDERLKIVETHLVEISLPRNYPRTPPQCRMLSPIFHPNIAPHAICVGDHWSAGEPLWSIVARIGEMLAYQSYNTKSPLNGEAARWVDEHLDRLPLDAVSLMVEEASPHERAVPAPPPRARRQPSARPTSAESSSDIQLVEAKDSGEFLQFDCPECGTRYRVPANTTARRARCKRCRTIITIGRSA
ncbi:MAG: ubiquitin-conjugating enzyme E2 [Planctomycetes bacterium]|nr:ubiquitin-conjugating enzyme E2 [Planctomycetota bacterium]